MDNEQTTSTQTTPATNGLGFSDWKTWAKVAGLLGQTAGKAIRAGVNKENPFDKNEKNSWEEYGKKMGEYFADKNKEDVNEEEQTEDFTYGD